MKRLQLLLVFACFLGIAKAQSPVDGFFDKYAGKEGFTVVYISEYMLSLFSQIEENNHEAQEMKEVTGKLTGIKILASESNNPSLNFIKEVKKIVTSNDDYKELMIIKEGEQDVQFLLREKGEKITELLLIVSGGGENVLISIQGDIDLNNISKLSNAMGIEEMEKLENIEKNGDQ